MTIDAGDQLDTQAEYVAEDGAVFDSYIQLRLEQLKVEANTWKSVFHDFMTWYGDQINVNRGANDELWKTIYDVYNIPEKEQHRWYAIKTDRGWVLKEREVDNPLRAKDPRENPIEENPDGS